MDKNDKKELFATMPVPKAIAAMAVPTIISQLINLVYNVVDTFFIGRTGNSYMVAAVTVSFTLFMMTVAFSNLFGVGGGSLMARLIGRDEPGRSKQVCAFSFYGAIAIALFYSLFIFTLLDPLLRALGASDATIGYARQYVLVVVVAGNLPVILSGVVAHLLRNAGYSKQASIGLSGGGILNIALDPLFMFVLLPKGQEVLGAAIATLIANIASCLYLVTTLKRISRTAPLSMSIREAKTIRRSDIGGLFAVGVPSAILTGLFDVANIVLNALMSTHGDLALAAIGIVMKVERLPNAINLGICQGMLPIVAYNFAAKNEKRMREVMNTARLYGLVISALSIALFETLATPLVRVFLNTSAGDAEAALTTIAFATSFIRIRCLASPFQFMNYHTSFCMQAMGDGRDTLLHAIVRELVCYIPFMYLLNALFGTTGLVCAVVAGEACGAVFAIFMLRRWMKKLRVQAAKA